MKHKYVLTIIREIRHSFGRFVAIIAIVALGVGFLVGILSSTPDMKASADRYYRENSMSDFNIKSTMGLTGDDVAALAQLPETDRVMAAYSADALMTSGDGEVLAGRLYGLDLSKNKTPEFVNDLTVLKGRMPESAGECVIENPNTYMSPLSIGDVLNISKENEDLDDTYAQQNFTIVGIVDNPYYFCNANEPASAGNGRIGLIAYTYADAYCLDAYTDIFLTLKDNKRSFSESYKTYTEKVTAAIEKVSVDRIQSRYDEVVSEAKEKLADSRQDLDQEKKKAQKQLADARAKLEQGQKELDQGHALLKNAKAQIASGKSKLKNAKAQFKNGKAELKKAKAQLASGKTEFETGKAQLDVSKAQLDAVKDEVEQARQAQEAGMPLPADAAAQIKAYDEGLTAYEKGLDRLRKEEKKLNSADKQIKATAKKLQKAEQEIKANEKKLQKAEKEIQVNGKKLADAKVKLANGRIEYEEGQAESEAEFARAEKKIKKAEQEIEALKKPEWYILGRDSNVSYARYKVDIEKVADIATVFPVFFFLIAALVALTTMTRMVEEERIQIGTLKALGYNRLTIISKYLIYCGTATVLGCAIGLAGGFQLLPTIIYNAYASQYDLPDLVLQFNWQYAAAACGLEILCTLGAAWYACSRTLREKPALLMIPRAPKAGKRIVLEKLGFIWKRLSFSHKATARNIFRYKKHLLMTIIGIAGCTALMVTGFGMQDSMSEIVTTQYKEILKYDMTIELTEDKTDKILDQFLEKNAHTKISRQTATASSDGKSEKITTDLIVSEDSQAFSDFVNLREMDSKAPLSFDSKAVIMTAKMADMLNLTAGDRFTLSNAGDQKAEFTLTGVTENYVGCYLYMNKAIYALAYESPKYNGYLIRSGLTELSRQDQTAARLQDSKYVSSSEFTTQTQETYEQVLSSIDTIVYVLILCAGALAVVVLYNLTNININERSRELATLRVLGYHHYEVARYIFREIAILSILGTLAGLILGRILHLYVIETAESVDFMMGRQISMLSYLMAAGITLVFSALVDFIMVFKLRRIEMVESMKAVD